jgi:hypothetical protein
MRGAKVTLDPGGVAPHAYLFGEDASRIVISFAPAQRQAVESWAARAKVPLAVVGEVGGDALRIEGLVDVSLDALSRAFRESLPGIVKRPARDEAQPPIAKSTRARFGSWPMASSSSGIGWSKRTPTRLARSRPGRPARAQVTSP